MLPVISLLEMSKSSNNCNLSNHFDESEPVRFVARSPNSWRLLISERNIGIGPGVQLFSLKNKWFKDCMFPNVEGMSPDRWLLVKSRWRNDLKYAIVVGNVPVRELLLNDKNSKGCLRMRTSWIVPLIWLSLKSKTLRFGRQRSDAGGLVLSKGYMMQSTCHVIKGEIKFPQILKGSANPRRYRSSQFIISQVKKL